MSKKIHSYYYFDLENDDFANMNIKTKKTKLNYEYLPSSKKFKVLKKLTHIFLVPLACIWEFFILFGKIHNKKVLKKINKKQGYVVYGNHTAPICDAFSTHYLCYPKEAYIIAHQDSLSIKGIGYLVRCLGALPVPNHYKNYINLLEASDTLLKNGKVISIYPEAHIWPYYNKLRPFPTSSFHYPYRVNAPSFAKTTIYKKGFLRKAKPVIYLDGPFYVDYSLPKKDAIIKLRDEIHNAIENRIINHKSILHPNYRYIKVNSKEEVRIEIN